LSRRNEVTAVDSEGAGRDLESSASFWVFEPERRDDLIVAERRSAHDWRSARGHGEKGWVGSEGERTLTSVDMMQVLG
jgi:hypothetical protein